MKVPLAVKLGLPVTALLVTAVAVPSGVLLGRAERSLLAESAKRGQTIAQHLANAARAPLLNRDELTLNVVVKEALKDSELVYMVITDHQGELVAHGEVGSGDRGRQRAAKLAGTVTDPIVESSVTTNGRVLDVAIPLVFRRTTVGAVFVGMNQRSVDEAISQSRNYAIALGLAMVPVGVAVSFGLAMLMTRAGRTR